MDTQKGSTMQNRQKPNKKSKDSSKLPKLDVDLHVVRISIEIKPKKQMRCEMHEKFPAACIPCAPDNGRETNDLGWSAVGLWRHLGVVTDWQQMKINANDLYPAHRK